MSARPAFEPGPANRAFLLFVCAILWVFIIPVFAVVGLFTHSRTNDALQDAGNNGADWGCEGTFHAEPNITGAERNHG